MKDEHKGFRESDLMTLCGKCERDFADSDAFDIERADFNQRDKCICTFCNARMGFDFYVRRKASQS